MNTKTYRVFRSREDDEDLYWSNEDGWVDLQSATLFPDLASFPIHPPLLSVAQDLVSKDGEEIQVLKTLEKYPPSKVQKQALLDRLIRHGVKDHQEQISICAAVLEDAGIQCLEEDTLDLLIATVAAHINEGKLSCDCLVHEVEQRAAVPEPVLPCPFCGGEGFHVTGNRAVRQPDIAYCLACDAMIEGDYEPRSALDKWNRRN